MKKQYIEPTVQAAYMMPEMTILTESGQKEKKLLEPVIVKKPITQL